MRRAFLFVTSLAGLVAAGLVHGQWTHRWTTAQAVEAAAARLDRVPLNFGQWRGRSLELGREVLALAEIDGYVSRRYENRSGKSAVTVLLVCGRPGPISVHTPDICYSGAGYQTVVSPASLSLPVPPSGEPAEFRHAVFGKLDSAVPTHLRILWSWSGSGTWEAPANPRLRFAPRQVLYKLYVIREMTTVGERVEDDPSLEFLRMWLPELERALFANL